MLLCNLLAVRLRQLVEEEAIAREVEKAVEACDGGGGGGDADGGNESEVQTMGFLPASQYNKDGIFLN